MQAIIDITEVIPCFCRFRIDLQCALETVNRAIHPPLFEPRASPVGVCRVKRRIGRNRLIETGLCTLGLTALLQKQPEVVVGLGKVGTQAQCLPIELLGQILAAPVTVQIAEVKTGGRVLARRNAVSREQLFLGINATVHVLEGQAKVDMHFRGIDTSRNGPQQRLNRFGRAAFGTQQFAVQHIGFGNGMPHRLQLIKCCPRLRQTFRPEQGQRHVEPRIDMARIQRYRRSIGFRSLRPTPERGKHDPPIVMVGGTKWIKGTHLSHQFHGFAHPPLPVENLRQQMQGFLVTHVGGEEFTRHTLGSHKISG